MPETYSTTIIILLSEIIIFLIILVIFLFIRLKNSKKGLKKSKNHSDNNTKNNPLSYIEKSKLDIEARLNILTSSENSDQLSALRKRFDFLESEKSIIESHINTNDPEPYWEYVQNQYLNNQSAEFNNDNSNIKEKVYLSRIESLENFKNMFFHAQENIKEMFETIKQLRNKIQDTTELDTTELEGKIKNLEDNKQQLEEHLSKITQELDENIKALQLFKQNNNTEELENLKEENEFLVNQIQHLLQQEVQNSKNMKEKMQSLENTINEKELENKKLMGQRKAP